MHGMDLWPLDFLLEKCHCTPQHDLQTKHGGKNLYICLWMKDYLNHLRTTCPQSLSSTTGGVKSDANSRAGVLIKKKLGRLTWL
jgi:hypothetical protein